MPGSDVERRDGDHAHPVDVAITDGTVDWTFAQGTIRARAVNRPARLPRRRPPACPASTQRGRPRPSDAGIGDTNADTDGGARATSRHHERHRKNEHTCASHGGHGSRSIWLERPLLQRDGSTARVDNDGHGSLSNLRARPHDDSSTELLGAGRDGGRVVHANIREPVGLDRPAADWHHAGHRTGPGACQDVLHERVGPLLLGCREPGEVGVKPARELDILREAVSPQEAPDQRRRPARWRGSAWPLTEGAPPRWGSRAPSALP